MRLPTDNILKYFLNDGSMWNRLNNHLYLFSILFHFPFLIRNVPWQQISCAVNEYRVVKGADEKTSMILMIFSFNAWRHYKTTHPPTYNLHTILRKYNFFWTYVFKKIFVGSKAMYLWGKDIFIHSHKECL